MDDLIDGLAGLGDGYDLEDLSRAYAQLLADQELMSESLDAEPANTADENVLGPGHGHGARERAAIDQSDRKSAESAGSPVGSLSGLVSHSPPTRVVEPNADAARVIDLRRSLGHLTDGDAEDRVAITPQRIVESILFVGTPDNSPISGRLLASLMRGVSPDEIQAYVEELNASYRADGSAFYIATELLGYRLEVAATHSALRNQFYGQVREVRLAQPVIDILAIIAYHQPIAKGAVEKLIGSPCGGSLNQLLRRKLISLVKEPGVGAVYRTTERFLELFDLDSLDDLPQSEAVDSAEETP